MSMPQSPPSTGFSQSGGKREPDERANGRRAHGNPAPPCNPDHRVQLRAMDTQAVDLKLAE
jgi:hypothetical protein